MSKCKIEISVPVLASAVNCSMYIRCQYHLVAAEIVKPQHVARFAQ